MKNLEYNDRKKYLSTMVAVGEGIWNGIVVSGILVVSAFLIRSVFLM